MKVGIQAGTKMQPLSSILILPNHDGTTAIREPALMMRKEKGAKQQ